MSDQPIKAASREASSQPFYLMQTNGTDKRYIAWLRDKIRIRTLLAGFINQSGSAVDVKIRDFTDSMEGADYQGEVLPSALHQLMTRYEDVLFHNGYHDFMVRIPETNEYIVFDEHGLIFIYSSNDYEKLLADLGASYSPDEKLIYEFDHWHYCSAEGKEKLISFIEDLGLTTT